MKKENKQQLPKARAHKRGRIRLLPVTAVSFAIVAILFSFVTIKKFLRTCEYFNIKEVIFNEETRIDLSYLKGNNIFSVDLRGVASDITRNHPLYKQASLIKILPNRVFVNLKKRDAVAYLSLYKYFSVDKEAVVFQTHDSSGFIDQLPVINGLEDQIRAPKLGKRYNIKELIICLNLLKRIRSSKALRSYEVGKINIDKLSNISFFIVLRGSDADAAGSIPISGRRKDLEIRIDAYNLGDKLDLLAGLLNQEAENLGRMAYIDLRFKEPVIKFNDDSKRS